MATKPLSDLTATWNNVATTFTAIKMNATDTTSAAGSLLIDLQVGGVSQFKVGKTGTAPTAPAVSVQDATLWSPSGGTWAFGSVGNAESFRFEGGISGAGMQRDALLWWSAGTTGAYSQRDTILARDAANTLALRNSTNAQAFRVYSTYTDASNYERVALLYSTGAGVFQLLSDALGTGTARQFHVGTNNAQPLVFLTANTPRWQVNAGGHFLTGADNTYDIGASGATRPRNVYVGTDIVAGGGAAISGNTTITGAGQAALTVGAGAGSRYLTINGANSGANGGATVSIQNNGSALGTFGNKSSLLGTGYDAQIAFYSVNGFEWLSSGFSTYMKLHNAGGLSLNGAANAGLGTLHAASFIKTTPKTVATLTAAATAGAGARDFVTDALAPTFGSAVVGGGAVNIPVHSTGAAWNVG